MLSSDQELATETQVAKAKTARRGPAVITKAKPSLNNGHSDALADFAPPLEDPFEDTPIGKIFHYLTYSHHTLM